MRLKLFLSLFLASGTLIANIQDHLVPAGVTAVSSNDLSHANHFYSADPKSCAFALFVNSYQHERMLNGIIPRHPEGNFPYTGHIHNEFLPLISANAVEIRERTYSETTQLLLRRILGRESFDPSALPIAADSMQDGGDVFEMEFLRHGLPAPDGSAHDRSVSLRYYNALFTLFKVNQLPTLLANRMEIWDGHTTTQYVPGTETDFTGDSADNWRLRRPRREVYFKGVAFWGAALNLEELLTLGLEQARKFRHMTLYLNTDEIRGALLLNELEGLESLTIVLDDAHEMEDDMAPLAGWNPLEIAALEKNFSKLKRLVFYNRSNYGLVSTVDILSFLKKTRLESLILRDVAITGVGDTTPNPSLGTLAELRIYRPMPAATLPAELNPMARRILLRNRLSAFFRELNPAVAHLEIWQTETTEYPPEFLIAALAAVPKYTGLQTFRLRAPSLSLNAWRSLLGETPGGPSGILDTVQLFTVDPVPKARLGKRVESFLRRMSGNRFYLETDSFPEVIYSRR